MKRRNRWVASQASLLQVAAILWASAGLLLLIRGLRLLGQLSISTVASAPLVDRCALFCGDRGAAIVLLVVLALGLATIKARFVLRPLAARTCAALAKQEEPVAVSFVFGWRYLLLFAGAGMMSFLLNRVQIAEDLRGVVSAAVGGALLNSASVYHRAAVQRRQVRSQGWTFKG